MLLQRYPELELIVIDAGSTDGTLDIIRRYEPWLAAWVSEPDRGQSHAINKGLLRSRGRFFNWHNADDLLVSDTLRQTVPVLCRCPEVGLVYGYPAIINHEGSAPDPRVPADARDEIRADAAPFVAELRVGCQPGALMDRRLVMRVGMLDENLHYVMDADLFLRIALERPVYHLARTVALYRLHPDAKTVMGGRRMGMERLRIVDRLFRRGDLPESVRRVERQARRTACRYAARSLRRSGAPARALVQEAREIACGNVLDMARWRTLVAEVCRLAMSGGRV